MTDSRKALKRLRKQANKASLMIDIGPLSDEDWELCATAARATVPRLLDALEKVLELADKYADLADHLELFVGGPSDEAEHYRAAATRIREAITQALTTT